jgi:hypothetical protein
MNESLLKKWTYFSIYHLRYEYVYHSGAGVSEPDDEGGSRAQVWRARGPQPRAECSHTRDQGQSGGIDCPSIFGAYVG